jgi:hypothetical protein
MYKINKMQECFSHMFFNAHKIFFTYFFKKYHQKMHIITTQNPYMTVITLNLQHVSASPRHILGGQHQCA